MTKELFIRMVENGKESELTVSNPSKEAERKLLSGVLKFMNINLTIDDLRIQKLYEDFYDGSFNPQVSESNEPVKVLDDLSAEELFNKGIKRNARDEYIYRCRYECQSCGNKGNHYIKPRQKGIPCHRCSEEMKTQELDMPDENFNYFLAGNARTEK